MGGGGGGGRESNRDAQCGKPKRGSVNGRKRIKGDINEKKG